MFFFLQHFGEVNRDHNLVKNYKCVLTYNSLYAIDCLYNGIPVISLSDSSLQNQFAKYKINSKNKKNVRIILIKM